MVHVRKEGLWQRKTQKGLMTSGNIYEQLIFFSIPLLLGNFFQLMYNTIDSVVVGNFVGPTALAAVGASTPIINFMIAFFMGLATGAGVVVSRYYGAREKVMDVHRSVHTFLTFSIALWDCTECHRCIDGTSIPEMDVNTGRYLCTGKFLSCHLLCRQCLCNNL
jgi:hypothetical protein